MEPEAKRMKFTKPLGENIQVENIDVSIIVDSDFIEVDITPFHLTSQEPQIYKNSQCLQMVSNSGKPEPVDRDAENKNEMIQRPFSTTCVADIMIPKKEFVENEMKENYDCENSEKTFDLTQLAMNSTVLVSALETIPRLRRKCAMLNIKANFDVPEASVTAIVEDKKAVQPSGYYEVERILDHDTINHLYLIKWKGWDHSFNTWEPIDHLSGVLDLVADFRLMERSLSEKNKKAFKILISLNCLIEELISLDNDDPYILLKLNGKSAMDVHRPGDLLLLKKSLKKNYSSLQKCLKENGKEFSLNYKRALDKILKGLNITESFESFEKLLKFSIARKGIFKSLKNWEAKINRTISQEEGCAPIEIENNVDSDIPKVFTYITKCIPGPDVKMFDEPIWSCACEQGCFNSKNCCPSVNSSKIIYNQNGCLKYPQLPIIFECNSKCKCPSSCPNRVIQKGRQFKLGIFKSDDGRGWGVKALEKIPKGRFVEEYVGEIVTSDEAIRRSNLGLNPFHKTYLFDLQYGEGADYEYVVDGAKFGNVSHFINHSCSPNLEVYMFWVDNPDLTMPRIALFSLKSINKGEEITFDYRMSAPRTADTNEDDDEEVPFTRVPCKCRSPNCRKFLF